MTDDEHWMRRALELAVHAEQRSEVPVGAVLTRGNSSVGEGWNQPISSRDPTAHAEVIAIRKAAGLLGNYRLCGTTLYVTLEPCPMCVGAMIHARINRLVFGAYDPKTGAVESVFDLLNSERHNHSIEYVGGMLESECVDILQRFFKTRRGKN